MDVPRERYSSPEEAAISSYPSAASARVVRVEPLDDGHVDVIVDSDPSYLMRVHCGRRDVVRHRRHRGMTARCRTTRCCNGPLGPERASQGLAATWPSWPLSRGVVVGRLAVCNALGYTRRSDPQLQAQGAGQVLRDWLEGRCPASTCRTAASHLRPVERRHLATRHGAPRAEPSSARG